jgi:uncharacterized protein (TIGR03118 family)
VVEQLGSRLVPAAGYVQTNLVADQAGQAPVADPKLVNAWGIALDSGGTLLVADNGTGVSTAYYPPNGQPVPGGSSNTIPPPNGSPPGTTAAPTGIAFHSGSGFGIPSGSRFRNNFLVATEDGTIAVVGQTTPAVDNSAAGAVYKGLTLGDNAGGTFLYAANFRAGRIDVFDSKFASASLPGTFTDPAIPAGFAPFNILQIGQKLYVTYAKQDAAKHDDVAGPGNGFVDVYDTNGVLLQHLVSGGPLNSPWGVALAPPRFGPFAHDLLVGNFGDGHINAFDPNTGAFQGQLKDLAGKVITIDGLWGLTFGNGAGFANPNVLYFTAGPGGEKHGLLGTLQARANPDVSYFAVGADAGGPPEVKVFDARTGNLKFDFMAYSSDVRGGVRVAVGDVDGDGVPDIVTAAGPGGGPHVKVFSGKDGSLLRSFFAYDASFFGGVFVAVGDTNGDGFGDIITGADAGGGPHVKVFSGKDNSLLLSFFAYDPTFFGGVRVASGDVNADGFDDIITGAGPGGAPHVKVFNGRDGSLRTSFFAFNASSSQFFTGGVYVGSGDINGDGFADVIVGAGAGGGPHVQVFSPRNGSLVLRSFFAYDASFRGGVRVATIPDVNNDGNDEVVTGAGPGGGPHVQVFDDGNGMASLDSFFAYNATFFGGVFVGGH